MTFGAVFLKRSTRLGNASIRGKRILEEDSNTDYFEWIKQ